jgi:hypothetical protein
LADRPRDLSDSKNGWAHSLQAARRVAHAILASQNGQRPLLRQIHFSVATDGQALAAVGTFRHTAYQRWRQTFVLDELAENGLDRYDGHSFVYVVWLADRPIATIRATPWPFKAADHVPILEIDEFLKPSPRSRCVELGRLVADDTVALRGITMSLIAFAIVHLRLATPYRHLFGYMKRSAVRRLQYLGVDIRDGGVRPFGFCSTRTEHGCAG